MNGTLGERAAHRMRGGRSSLLLSPLLAAASARPTYDRALFTNCSAAPAPADAGNGRCLAANNVPGCWDGGDCCAWSCGANCAASDCELPCGGAGGAYGECKDPRPAPASGTKATI